MKNTLSILLSILSILSATAQLPQINLIQLTTGYDSPVDIKNCGDQRLFIVEQDGYIRILYKNGTKQTTPFLDIDARVNSGGNEQGLLGLAFSPNYKQDGFFYVNYINGTGAGATRISRFSVMPNDSSLADPNSEVVLLTFTQPYSNHNGGNMMFGPDGYLYVAQGDGGSANDPQNNAQNRNSFLGKMLRLDVTGQTTYAVPSSNPFVGQSNVKTEIWSYGLRNPWRCSFDRITGDLWMGDVGQDAWEEIDFQNAASSGGENYGWRCREGMHTCPTCNVTGCTGTGYTEPVYEMQQSGGVCSVTGGYVYRGAQYSKLFGLYLHSDFCAGRIWSTKNLGNNVFDTDSPTVFVNGTQTFLTNNIGTFGEDNLGELYIAGRANGRIYRVTETSDCKPVAFIGLQDTIEGCAPTMLTALRGDTLNYQWYDGNGLISSQTDYQLPVSQTGWYKVSVSRQQPGCETLSDSVFVLIRDTTSITLNSTDTLICITEPTFGLASYVSPVGGTFAGNGVNTGSFNPTVAGNGTSTINYTFSNNVGCESTYRFNLLVGDAANLTPTFTLQDYCSDAPDFSLEGFIEPSGGSYSGNAVSDNNFSPATAYANGETEVFYEYVNSYGCISRDTFGLNVVLCTGVINEVDGFSFYFFPNPTTGVSSLNIYSELAENIELIVSDASGKECDKQFISLIAGRQIIPLNLTAYAQGIYSIRLKRKHGEFVKQVVVEK